jgi:hypothetical protein
VVVGLAKTELYAALRKPLPDPGEPFPPGFVHLPRVDAETLKQLTAGQLVTRRDRRGYARRDWKKMRECNELLDGYVYARAAAAIIGLDRFNDVAWSRLERHGARAPEPEAPETEPPEAPPASHPRDLDPAQEELAGPDQAQARAGRQGGAAVVRGPELHRTRDAAHLWPLDAGIPGRSSPQSAAQGSNRHLRADRQRVAGSVGQLQGSGGSQADLNRAAATA